MGPYPDLQERRLNNLRLFRMYGADNWSAFCIECGHQHWLTPEDYFLGKRRCRCRATRQRAAAANRKRASVVPRPWWSTAVRYRDNYRCTVCLRCSTRNHAHHLNDRQHFPRQSLTLRNGLTLCASCHRRYHHTVPFATKATFLAYWREHNGRLETLEKSTQAVIRHLMKLESSGMPP